MKKSPALKASSLRQNILQTIARQVTSSVREVERAKLILAMLQGKSNKQVSQELGYSWEKAKRWRYKWIALQPTLDSIETATDAKKVRFCPLYPVKLLKAPLNQPPTTPEIPIGACLNYPLQIAISLRVVRRLPFG